MASKQILSLAAATACRFMCLYLFMPFALYTTMLCPTSAAKEHSLVRQFTGSLGTSSVQSDAQALINFMRESDPLLMVWCYLPARKSLETGGGESETQWDIPIQYSQSA
jgi:hypothetical protein